MLGQVFQALIPVTTLIVLGYLIVRFRWLRAEGMQHVSNIAFLVLAPALLFRSVASVHLAKIDFTPVVIYFCAIWIVFAIVMVRHGFNKLAAVLALSTTLGCRRTMDSPGCTLTRWLASPTIPMAAGRCPGKR